MENKLQIETTDDLVEVHISGKLTHKSYEEFVPLVEQRIREHGKLRMLVVLHDFHGWSAGALWDDLKFDLGHFRDIARLAIVGETKWQHGMAVFCKPFTTAKIRYFPSNEIEAARTWLAKAATAPPQGAHQG